MKKLLSMILSTCLLAGSPVPAEETDGNSFLLKVWNRSGLEISYLRFDFYAGDTCQGYVVSCPDEGEDFYRCPYTPGNPEELKDLRIVCSYGISEMPPERAVLQVMTGNTAEQHELQDLDLIPECGKIYMYELVSDDGEFRLAEVTDEKGREEKKPAEEETEDRDKTALPDQMVSFSAAGPRSDRRV